MSSPKKKRGLWSEDNLKAAIKAVQTKQLTQRAAADMYKIPRRTLRNHLKSGVTSKIIGKQTTLSKHQEQELCQRIKRFAAIGLPLTPRFIRKQAFQFCERFDIQHNFNRKKEMAGPDWLRLFLKRNPSISKRKPQIMNPARAQKLNKPIVQHHFQEIKKLYEELDIFDHPERLYNMDEKGCRITMHHQHNVLAAKGSKRVRLIAPEHAENVTIAMCVNAIGTCIPPMIIFKGQRNNPELSENLPAGTLVRIAKKGSMTLDLFVEFIQHLGKHKVSGKCLLVFDGAKSHMSYEVVQEAEKNDIILYCLPSNTTHELQPLDKSVNRSYEHYWDEEVLRVLYNKPDTKLTKVTFNKMFSRTWPKCMTHTNIVNGFKATGLFPYDPEIIPDEAYAPSVLTEIQFQQDVDLSSPIPVMNQPQCNMIGQHQLSSNEDPISPQFSFNQILASSPILQPSNISSFSNYRSPLVDYSLSISDVSDDETEKGIHSHENITDKENRASPSILSVLESHVCNTELPHNVGSLGQYDEAVPSCSGLQKSNKNDSADFDTLCNYFGRKPFTQKYCVRDFYSFLSDDDTDCSIHEGYVTPKKSITPFVEYDNHANFSETSSSSDDNIPLIDITKNKNDASFHKLMPTPNYAKTKSEHTRKKAINYKGVKVTKDLFKEKKEKVEKDNKKSAEASSKIKKKSKSVKTISNRELCDKTDAKIKNKMKQPKKVKEMTSKEQNDEDRWYCHACLKEKVEDMRSCSLCNKWYHETCVGLTKADKEFICSYCTT